ncbi:hypothetical protein BDP27DRAFT_1366397 [Rhodocollybia butyracea]|uniref:Uncharacterized protein n=1 Tax=Rhodocollybia butyracea TaxID=206335 RepID=A0A9P5PGY6_9AGAR|nr:hypothetical protein BDP27DRAFT_1366397 [Rhodocollybia butyracea]
MPSGREVATPRSRQYYGRRIRTRSSTRTNSPTTGHSSSLFIQTRQSTPVYQRRSARLQEQQRAGDPPAIVSSNGENITSEIEFQAWQREVENTRVQFSNFKDAQRVRFTCPICLRLAVKPRIECLMQQRNYSVQNGSLMRCGAEIDALAEGSLDAERSSFVWFSSYESL